MPAQRLLTDEEEKTIRRSYEGGQSALDLAAAWDVNADTIRNAIKRQGGKMRKRGRQPGMASPRIR